MEKAGTGLSNLADDADPVLRAERIVVTQHTASDYGRRTAPKSWPIFLPPFRLLSRYPLGRSRDCIHCANVAQSAADVICKLQSSSQYTSYSNNKDGNS